MSLVKPIEAIVADRLAEYQAWARLARAMSRRAGEYRNLASRLPLRAERYASLARESQAKAWTYLRFARRGRDYLGGFLDELARLP